MSLLVLRAYLQLILFDLYLSCASFPALYEKVRKHPVAPRVPAPGLVEEVCYSIDMACIWYCKEVLCLQRSAATACLLKKLGVAAQMVVGTQQFPFRAHAWVEVNGRVVNDRPYTSEMYSVLVRC
jgi:hypothetical protein